MKNSRSEFIAVRGLRYHIRHWGDEAAPRLFMLHGWMDMSASFQFVVDSLRHEWHVIAPDWRGFGQTSASTAGCYWFPDYLGDLDAILARYSPEVPVNLLGHSMGGNVACLYAGVRPQRVGKLINLEGFGLPDSWPDEAPARYAKWLDELHNPPVLRSFASQADVARRLQKNNPRLSDERAAFLSGHWAEQQPGGEWNMRADPAHRLTNPVLYRLEEVLACWKAITAPVLWIEAQETDALRRMGTPEEARAEIDRRLQCIPDVRKEMVADAGHMLQHDQPEAVTALIENFLL